MIREGSGVGAQLATAKLALELAAAAVESGDWPLVAEQAEALAEAATRAAAHARTVVREIADPAATG